MQDCSKVGSAMSNVKREKWNTSFTFILSLFTIIYRHNLLGLTVVTIVETKSLFIKQFHDLNVKYYFFTNALLLRWYNWYSCTYPALFFPALTYIFPVSILILPKWFLFEASLVLYYCSEAIHTLSCPAFVQAQPYDECAKQWVQYQYWKWANCFQRKA